MLSLSGVDSEQEHPRAEERCGRSHSKDLPPLASTLALCMCEFWLLQIIRRMNLVVLIPLQVFVLWCSADVQQKLPWDTWEILLLLSLLLRIWAKKRQRCYPVAKVGCSERQKQGLHFANLYKKWNISMLRCLQSTGKMEKHRHVFVMDACNFPNRGVCSLETCNFLGRRIG